MKDGVVRIFRMTPVDYLAFLLDAAHENPATPNGSATLREEDAAPFGCDYSANQGDEQRQAA